MQFDVLITGGTVVDGTGKAGYRADVGIKGKKISAIGDLTDAVATRVIDATGQVVSPGFIDVHAHSDGALLNDGQHANGIRQGITTEIIAPDGLTLAPLSAENYRLYRWYLSGILGLPPENLDMSSIEAARQNYHLKTSCNVATFVGHGPVRLSAVGMHDVPLRGKELDAAKGLVRESLEQGAVGFATGLSYYPQSYSDTDELVELCKVVAEFDLPLSIHLRNHNTDRGFGGGGVEEALEIGRRSGVKVHFEHYRTQPRTAGQVEELLAPIDKAKSEGVDITLETYPYPVGSSFPPAFFPGWFHEGGPEEMLKRLADTEMRPRLVKEMSQIGYGKPSGNMWTWIGSEKNQHLVGMLFDDIADERGVSVEEMVCDVMLEEKLTCGFRGTPPAGVKPWRQVEKDIMQLMARDDYMCGSDSIPGGGMVHPRAYGCFPRFVGRLRRRYGYPLEQVVQRLTENPAKRFGLKQRGVIAEDNFADIVVFDAEHITDRSTFEDPAVHPEGIPFVLVNGKVAVDHERCTSVLAGEAVPS
ncbi:MAG: amidohydrolase family protein [Dehalococcoidia bacterium]